jgi:hypothetical protein
MMIGGMMTDTPMMVSLEGAGAMTAMRRVARSVTTTAAGVITMGGGRICAKAAIAIGVAVGVGLPIDADTMRGDLSGAPHLPGTNDLRTGGTNDLRTVAGGMMATVEAMVAATVGRARRARHLLPRRMAIRATNSSSTS